MSRILEFQPMDEHTVVSRVLIELHNAIDLHFPQANPSGRQFTKTVLTNQSDATRVDNIPAKAGLGPHSQSFHQDESAPQKQTLHGHDLGAPFSEMSMTPKTGVRKALDRELLRTADVRRLIGDSRVSQLLRFMLLLLLALGVGIGIWLVFFRADI